MQPFNPSNPGNPSDKKKTGTGFTNLNRIMEASKGNRLGQAVGGGVQAQAGQARSTLNQARSEFQQQSEQNRLDSEANKQKAQQGIEAAKQGNVDEGTLQDFSRFRQGQYSGPQELSNQQQVVNQAQQAQGLGQLAGSSGGRQALLQRFVGGAGYSQGKQRLDNLLLGQSGGDQLRQARRETQMLGRDVGSATEAARQKAQYLQNKAQEFAGQVGKDISSASTGLESDINKRVQEYTQLDQQNKEAADALQSAIAGGNVSEEEVMQRLASNQFISPEQKKNLLNIYSNAIINNVDPVKALQNSFQYQQARNIGFQQVAQEQELQGLNALNQLRGQGKLYDPNMIIDKYQAGQLQLDAEKARQNIEANKGETLASLLSKGPNISQNDLQKFSQAGLTPELLSQLMQGYYTGNQDGGQSGLLGNYIQTQLLFDPKQYGSGGLTLMQDGTYLDPSTGARITPSGDSLADYQFNRLISSSPTYSQPQINQGMPQQQAARAQAELARLRQTTEQQQQSFAQQKQAALSKMQNMRNLLGLQDVVSDEQLSTSGGLMSQNQQTLERLLRNAQAQQLYQSGLQGEERINAINALRQLGQR